jgi:hypothetical protein
MGERETHETKATPSPEAREMTLNDIRDRAYQKWQAAGRPMGDCSRYWLEAEVELLQGK